MDNLKLYSKSLIVQSWKILCVDNSLICSGSQTTWKKLFAFFRKKILRGSPRKFIIITILPLILGGVGWLAWKRIQSNVKTCETCGSSFINSQIVCPICGKNIKNTHDLSENIPASAATIDIKSEDIDL